MDTDTPLVVQYLYVHGENEGFYYPSVRSRSSVARVAARYLECALTQAATLRLQDTRCELALATNVAERNSLGSYVNELLAEIERLDVRILPTEYLHRPGDDSSTYVSSRYVLDAMLAAADGQPADRKLWFPDLDCVWVDPRLMFDSAPADGEIGCIHLNYPFDWDVIGFGDVGRTPSAIGELSEAMGGPGSEPPWVGGELLCGTPDAIRALVHACEQLDTELAERGHVLATEEQVMTLAGALGRVAFSDLSKVAARIQTGARHESLPTPNPTALGLWHLPSEKGLSLRRTAQAVKRRRTARVRRDVSDPVRSARRFNVEGAGLGRRVRDDGWIVTQRLRDVGRSALGRVRGS